MHRVAGVNPGAVSSVQIIIIVIAVILTIGVLTCVVSHYKMGARSWSERWNRSVAQQAPHQVHHHVHHHHHHLENNPSTVLYVPPGAQDRLAHEVALFRERQIRLQSVQTDIELDLPPSIGLPDGEEYPYDSLHHLSLRNAEQESEIYRECIRPPPNRTIFEGESPPPYRSSSVGTLHRHHHHHHHHHHHPSGGGHSPRTESEFDGVGGNSPRCHSASSTNSGCGGSSGASSGRSTPLTQLRLGRLITRKTSSSSTSAADVSGGRICSGCINGGSVGGTVAAVSSASLVNRTPPSPSTLSAAGPVDSLLSAAAVARLAPSRVAASSSQSLSASSSCSRDSSVCSGVGKGGSSVMTSAAMIPGAKGNGRGEGV